MKKEHLELFTREAEKAVQEIYSEKKPSEKAFQKWSVIISFLLIYAIGELQKDTRKLTTTIKTLEGQNQKLARANFALQWTAMILGLIATFFGSSQLLSGLFNISSYPNLLVAGGVTLLLALFLEKKVRKIAKG